ncbi:hypothetical protein [Microvirga massiliensis]|uniref:hypothetical protein n=1 Tax=Microvirga massiliensis TaxID=1033741 RepID=UPI00062BA13C|nr:hypothetical protein [Microvirga massiliensis]
MPDFVTTRVKAVRRRHAIVLSAILVLASSAVPARAQDIFGLFRLFLPPTSSAPAFRPAEHPAGQTMEQPAARSRPRAVRVEPPAIKMPLKPRTPGEISNPVPELLADSSLRRGDMVMFPDGLRVFTGRPGGQHRLTDFEPVAQSGKTSSLAATLQPGTNPAWNAETSRPTDKIAANTKAVATTGSVKRTAR